MERKNYITPQGHKVLFDELNELMRVERPEIIKLIQWAASNGDRSENADYLYGKKRLREIDRRVRFLTSRIDASQVIDPSSIKSDKVQFGATVTVTDDQGMEKTFTIVGVDEVNTAKGHISWQSPIGRGLLGKKDGDEVVIQIPTGETTYEIVSVTYKSIT